MLYRHRNNDPIYRHAELPSKLLGDDDPGPQPGATPSPSVPAPKPTRQLLPSEMPHGDAVRNENVRDALIHMHERGHIDLFDIMANVLSETDEDDHEHPELSDLHSMAHHAADGLFTKEGYH